LPASGKAIMVKVIARQPVDAAAFEKLKDVLDPDGAEFSNGSPRGFTVKADEVRAEVKGNGFTYFPFTDAPQSGTISGINIFIQSDLAYVIKDAGIDVGEMIDNPPQADSAIRELLSGKDTFKGSSGDDVFAAGGRSDKLFGRAGDDELHGDAGKDELDGGVGADRLDGGGGKDTYVFRDPPESGIDSIVKFEAGEKFKIARSDFAGLAKGKLADSRFVEGVEAQDANDRFIYDSATGAVYHDPDGAGGTAQTQFALILVDPGNFGAGSIFLV
jgi:Ca2+-binding RTX toxin-like protein